MLALDDENPQSYLFLFIVLLFLYFFLQQRTATSDQALLQQWWKYNGDYNAGSKCSDLYSISETMLADRDIYWFVKYRYLSGDILLTVQNPQSKYACIYVSKR